MARGVAQDRGQASSALCALLGGGVPGGADEEDLTAGLHALSMTMQKDVIFRQGPAAA